MSTTTKTPRLLAAAKEFNIGKDTLVEFLASKGFDIPSNPNAKITEVMYDALQEEFAQDKLTKRKSEEIALPKGPMLEGIGKTKEELDLTIKDRQEAEESAPAAKSAKETGETTEEAAPSRTEEKAAEPAAPVAAEEKPEATEEIPASTPEEEVAAPAAKEAAPAEKEEDKEAGSGVKAPRLDGPHVLGKIDLDALGADGKSRRPESAKKKAKATESKTTKKKAETAAEESPAPSKQEDKEKTQEAAAAEEKKKPAGEAPKITAPAHIEMKAPKLEGPKIIGKIELPASPSGSEGRERRSRKRIPVAKRPESLRSGAGARGGRTGAGGKRTGDRRGRGAVSAQQQEIDAKAIQEKIRQTQAKMAAGSTRKGAKSKYRRSKREELAERRAEEEARQETSIQVTEFISVSELASLLDVSFADVISKCMNLGIMVSINQRLDAEVIELVAGEFGFEVEFIDLETEADLEEEYEDDEEDLVPRAPIVTIMGHVDHGKTSLLDYIRKANVVSGEAGGITQHIGAYQVETQSGKKITFLDTPGHEAFTAMRARGAKVADVAIIVIAADDAIMPQTKEAISHAQAANLPMVFAINKIDKESANPEKIKEQLAGMNILVEDWGGKYQCQEISAKKGINVDLLLEKIGLEAELLELKANPERPATGSVIEASLDKGRGYQATILVQTGTLRQGDIIVCGQFFGKIKAMFDFRGKRVDSVGPSVPVQVLGLNGAPQAGEKLKVYEEENEAKSVATHRSQIMREQGIRARKHITLEEIGRRLALGNFKELGIIIKGDFDGSVEALSDSLQKLSTEEVAVNVVHKGVGQITESDVLLATASDAIIIGFQVRPAASAAKLAEMENIEIRTYSIIYDAIEEVKSAMEGLLEPKIEKRIVANIEVREVYKISGLGTVAGSYVLDGKMTRNTKLNVVRDGIVIHTGELASLKRFKDDVKEVNAGYECGLMIRNFNDVQVGDIIEGYDEVEVKRTL